MQMANDSKDKPWTEEKTTFAESGAVGDEPTSTDTPTAASAGEAPAQSSAKRRIARYEILAKVGSGANGVVYRALDPTIRRVVALKVIAADPAETADATSGGPSSKGLFTREVQAAGALLHPNIVTLHDAGRDGDFYYLAMEFIEGETFAAEIARSGRVPVERAIEVVATVAEALDFAHRRGVVHRDIKPANLMILPDSTVKVADFGIARLTSAPGGATVSGGMILGTPSYMSPEQVECREVDGRSDLFSLGVVLYEAITGRKPFKAESFAATLHAILKSSPAAPHHVDPSIPQELSAIVMRVLARDPADRPQSGHDLAAELRAVQSSLEATTYATPPAPSTSAEPQVKLRRRALGTGVVALIALAATLLARRSLVVTATGYVDSLSDPPGAEIVLDGKVVGRTPYTFEVPAGTHEIEYRKDGYYPAQATIKVPADARVPVELKMLAQEEGR
jgi:serine/threonine protein kinase